jgi:hypothetical protein
MPTPAARQKRRLLATATPSGEYHTLLAHRSAAYQAKPSTRKATTTPLLPGLILGFPLIRGRDWGRDSRRPSRRHGDTRKASPRRCHACPQGFLPPTRPATQTIRRAPPNLPLTSTRHHGLEAILAISLWSPDRAWKERRKAAGSGIAAPQPRRRELPPPPSR